MIWNNNAVSFTGTLKAEFALQDGDWCITSFYVTDTSEPTINAELSDEELAAIIEKAIPVYCENKTNISNVTVTSRNEGNNRIVATAEYTSEADDYILTNSISVTLDVNITEGYAVTLIQQEKVESQKLKHAIHQEIPVDYKLKVSSTTPTTIPSSGTTVIYLDIDENCDVTVSFKLGSMSYNFTGYQKYGNDMLTLNETTSTLNVTYTLVIASLNYDTKFTVKPQLSYVDGNISGSIVFDPVSYSVNDFSVYIN
jgi:hypothetical protein